MQKEFKYPPPKRKEKLEDSRNIPISKEMKSALAMLDQEFTNVNEMTRLFWERAIRDWQKSCKNPS